MSRLFLVKITHEQLKEVFGSYPGDNYDHYLGTDTISETSKFVVLNQKEMEDTLMEAAESSGEFQRMMVYTYMTFEDYEFPEILIAINKKLGDLPMTKALTLKDDYFGGADWKVTAHIDDDGQLTLFVSKGEEEIVENYNRSDDGPGWVNSYVPQKVTTD